MQDKSRRRHHFLIMNIELKENRFKIFIGLLISVVFELPLIGYLMIFAKPLLNRLSDLSLKEIFLFGGVSVLCVFGICLLLMLIAFMLLKMFIPAKITITQEGVTGRTTQGVILWNDIASVDYLSIKQTGQSIPVILG